MIASTEVRFAARVDETEASSAERERVERILLEAADPDYWFAASRDGNREAHYRGALPQPARGFWPLVVW